MKTSTVQNQVQRAVRVLTSLIIVSNLFLGGAQTASARNIDESVQAAPCADPLGCVEIAPTDPIHIAYALAISGDVSFLGIDERNGVEIAIDDVGGQILGHDILFDGVDSECSDTGGTAAGAALAADPSIVAVVGTILTYYIDLLHSFLLCLHHVGFV